jgi:hypothetical protein
MCSEKPEHGSAGRFRTKKMSQQWVLDCLNLVQWGAPDPCEDGPAVGSVYQDMVQRELPVHGLVCSSGLCSWYMV